MKRLLLYALASTYLFSATPEQVEQYLSISNADEQLIELENQFSIMQENLNRLNSDEENTPYDMQLLSIRFKSYLQQHLSEEEMDEILKAYRNVLLLQYVSAIAQSQEASDKEIEAYLKSLEEDPQNRERIELAEKISDEMYDKESMAIMFDNLIKPLIENAPGGSDIDAEKLKERKEAYVKQMMEQSRKGVIYATRDFSIEELEALEKIAKEPAIKHESNAIAAATAYALEEFFLSLAKRYDISKHQ